MLAISLILCFIIFFNFRNSQNKSINLYDLRPESYEELVTHCETGLTFIVLVDEDSKKFLLEDFGKMVYPLTRYDIRY
jgi:hypothetical protein